MTRLKELLRESVIDPRSDGPLGIIVETSQSNPRYAEDRAIEMIREAQQAIHSPTVGLVQAVERIETYHSRMKDAITLLVLSRALKD